MRSVVKHSYIRGQNRFAKAAAHVNYIEYRAGDDRGKDGAREFFSKNRTDIWGTEVKEQMRELKPNYIHKLILSPGMQGVDMQAYTRSIMSQLEKEKGGLSLVWAATVHKNTDHDHAHVVLFGRDAEGTSARLTRNDYDQMREFGDRYLERHHAFERFIDNDMAKLLKGKEYSREGDAYYRELLSDVKRANSVDIGRENLPEAGHEKTFRQKEYPAMQPWDADKAAANLPERLKVRDESGRIYTHFDKLEDLQALLQRGNNSGEMERASDAVEKADPGYDSERAKAFELKSSDEQNIQKWINTKQSRGEDCYEKDAQARYEKNYERKKERHMRERPAGEDERIFKTLDEDLKKSMQQVDREGRSDGFGKGYQQRTREAQGRHSYDHGKYLINQEIAKVANQLRGDLSLEGELSPKIQELKELIFEDARERKIPDDVDKLFGWREQKQEEHMRNLLRPWTAEEQEKDPYAQKAPEPEHGLQKHEPVEIERSHNIEPLERSPEEKSEVQSKAIERQEESSELARQAKDPSRGLDDLLGNVNTWNERAEHAHVVEISQATDLLRGGSESEGDGESAATGVDKGRGGDDEEHGRDDDGEQQFARGER